MSEEHGSGGVGMPGDTAPPTTTPGEAYDAGMVDRRDNDPKTPNYERNPYYANTQQWYAWFSGWKDQNDWMARHR